MACFSGLSITDHLLENAPGMKDDKGFSKRVKKTLAGVPNEKIMVLPLKIGKWKTMHPDTVIEICRSCGKPITIGQEFAAFY